MATNTSTKPLSIEAPTTSDNRHYVFGWQQLQEVEKDLLDTGVAFVRSSNSIYVPSTRHKYLNVDGLFWWKDINGDLMRMTPGEIARVELLRAFGKPKIWVKKKDYELLKIPPPNFYDGQVYEGKLFYVDLSAAYHQIYSWLDIDCVWPRGEGMLPLASVASRLSEIKLARNAVVGISRSTSIWLSKGKKDYQMHIHNYYFNPALWRTIQSIMHQLAENAVFLGAVYVATDGYIFADEFDYYEFMNLLDYHQFTYKTEVGEGYIKGWASYKVGNKQTKIVQRRPSPLDNIILKERSLEWFKKIKDTRRRPSIIGVPSIPTNGQC